MAQWDEGYVTDVSYTSDFYREITPSWIGMTSLLLGHRPPNLAAPFSYADLGCGNGLSTLVIAATTPHADVWGFDFNPAHIEFATNLAVSAGLTNVHFVENSFTALAQAPDGTLPDFDIMVAHGVLTWISPANRKHLVSTVSKRLKPGGLVYLSYNVTTGWITMVPIRALMRMLAAASPERTDVALHGVLDFVDRLKQAGAQYFEVNPSVEKELVAIREDDMRYVAHEYMSQDWHPLMFAEIASEMLEAKCRYIGSATLTENIDKISVPPRMVEILSEARDSRLRETLRDLGCAQRFRRDLFRKGTIPMPAAEQRALLDEVVLVAMEGAPEGDVTFTTPIGSLTGQPDVYQPLLSMLDEGAVSIRRARESPAFVTRPVVELMQACTLLIAEGYAHPMLPDGGPESGHRASQRLNLALAGANANGANLPYLTAPAIGSAISVDILESLLIGELLAGKPADMNALSTELIGLLARSGRKMQRDDEVITDATDTMRILTKAVGGIVERRVPILRNLGVL